MSALKSIADVLEVAIRIERQGITFYKKLYDLATSPQARDAFAVLAAEEEGTFSEENNAAVKRLINEERLHLRKLFTLKSNIKL
jgi:rubrerythrin